MTSPKLRSIICSAIPLVWISMAQSATEPKQIAAELGHFFEQRESEGFSGVVLLAQGDNILLRSSYGHSSCDGPELTTEHVFLIGSITKVFTKLATYKLVAEGQLALGDPISDWLPDVPKDKEYITVGMLASHRSGFDDIIDAAGKPVPYSPDWDYLHVSKKEIIERAMTSALIFEPGSDRQYSNLGYSLLAAIVEKSSGMDYEAFVRKTVFEPLGMLHTGYVLPDWSGTTIADGCYNGKDWPMPFVAGRWLKDGPSWNLRGNGGMMGTLDDLVSWTNALRRADFLPAAIMQDFLTDITGRSRTFEETATAAAGGNDVYNSYYLWLIDSDIRLIMISNNGDYQVEGYLDVIYPLLKKLKASSNGKLAE